MGFAEVFGLTANTVRLCGLVRPICFAVEIDDELKLLRLQNRDYSVRVRLQRSNVFAAPLQSRYFRPRWLDARDAKPSASQAVSRI